LRRERRGPAHAETLLSNQHYRKIVTKMPRTISYMKEASQIQYAVARSLGIIIVR